MSSTVQPMTAARVEEIRGRLDAAMPGPWTAHHGLLGGYSVTLGRSSLVICQRSSWDSRPEQSRGNADLIAHAPADIAALLAEIERLQPRWRPEAEWHDDLGPVLWARYPVDEPPYVGTPGDTDWIGDYYTHFCALPAVDEDLQARAALGEGSHE